MFELFFWILQAAIEVYFTIVIYEKINKVKSSFYFTFLCAIVLILLPLLILNLESIFSLSRHVLYFILLLIYPLFFYRYFYKKEKLSTLFSIFLSLLLFLQFSLLLPFFPSLFPQLQGIHL